MVRDSIDIQPPFAKKKREFIAKHANRPDSIYTQKRDFNHKGLLERETWELDNGQEVFVLDDAAYISEHKSEELKMEALEPSALMELAKRQDYTGDKGLICFLHGGQIYYSSRIVEVDPPFAEDFESEYDISQDLEDFERP